MPAGPCFGGVAGGTIKRSCLPSRCRYSNCSITTRLSFRHGSLDGREQASGTESVACLRLRCVSYVGAEFGKAMSERSSMRFVRAVHASYVPRGVAYTHSERGDTV